MAEVLSNLSGEDINRKRIQRLRRILGLETFYPKPRLTVPNPEHEVYPYRLRGVEIQAPNHVWSTPSSPNGCKTCCD